MYEIILECWYQETPTMTYNEVYPTYFDNLEDACEYLGKNCTEILNWRPAEKITIRYNHSRIKE